MTGESSPRALRLRPVERGDAELLHRWANDPVTRWMSFSTDAIPLDTHRKWLDARLRDPDCLFYLVIDAQATPVGQVRFDLDADGGAEISVAVAPDRRGQGLGAAAIRLASDTALEDGRIRLIRAEIRPENGASVRAFARAGYGPPETVTRGDTVALRMIARAARAPRGVSPREQEPSRMEPRYRNLLDEMLADMSAADPLFQPTRYWQICSQRLLADLEKYGLEQFRSAPASLAHFVPLHRLLGHDGPDRALRASLSAPLDDHPKLDLALEDFVSGRAQARSDYRVIRAGDREGSPYLDGVSESGVGSPAEQFEFDGRAFSRSMLNYLMGLVFAKQLVGDLRVRTVLEIGGGFGTLGEILLSDPRNECFYLDVDIPPTALFATYYLEQVFGRERVLTYSESRTREALPIDELRRPGGAAMLCPWQLPRLEGEIDLFVNFISFQEMEPEVVANYLKHVRRLNARHVLLRNIREGRETAKDDGALGVATATRSDHYDEFLPDYELLAANVLPFGYPTVDGFHSELKLFRLR